MSSLEATLTPQQEEEVYGTYILKPSEVNTIWEAADPKRLMVDKLKTYIHNEC